MQRVPFAALLTVILAVATGCTVSPSVGSSLGDSELINDIASRLGTAMGESYTATYAIGTNGQASVAHTADPDTTAYRYPNGMVLMATDSVTSCTTTPAKPSCRVLTGSPASSVNQAIESGGMVRVESVISKLTQTSLNADAIVAESDRTVSGTDESCIFITGLPAANDFTACVTAEGLLGAFNGTIDGVTVDARLVHFSLSVDVAAFVLPNQ